MDSYGKEASARDLVGIQENRASVDASIFACLASLDVLIQQFNDGLISAADYRRQLNGLFRDLYENIGRNYSLSESPVNFLARNKILEIFPNVKHYLEDDSPFRKQPSQEPSVSRRRYQPLQRTNVLYERHLENGGPVIEKSLTSKNLGTDYSFSLPSLTIWERIHKKGRYYKSLCSGILRLSKSLRERTGGIVALSELLILIHEASGSNVSVSELRHALSRLKRDRLIPGIQRLSSGVEIVELFPLELGADQHLILDLAVDKGWTSLEEILLKTRWTEARARRLLKDFEEKGIAHFDESYKDGNRWYFPGFFHKR
ncbi:MAG: hypothetical protein ACTSW4_02440 [Candidatus Ranarchaeia archaeon]